MIPLLPLLLALTPECGPLPGGGEACYLAQGHTPWIELGLALATPADPEGQSGLSLVGARAVESALLSVSPHLVIEGRAEGLLITGGLPVAELETELERIISVLARRFSAAETEAAVSRAIEARRHLQDDDRALAQLEVERGLYGAATPGVERYGDLQTLATISSDMIGAWQRRVICAQNLRLVLAGPVGELPRHRLASLSSALPACAPALKRGASKSTPPTALDLVLIDKPERPAATLVLGTALGTELSAAHEVAAVALSGPAGLLGQGLGGGRIQAELAGPPGHPELLITVRTPQPAPALAQLLPFLASRPRLDEAARARARGLAVTDAAAQVRDAAHSVRSILLAQLRGQPAQAPFDRPAARAEVSDEALDQALQTLLNGQPRWIAVVASAEAGLVQALGRVPGVRRTSVVAYDTR